MATLADMKTRIASEIARADLGTQIANAINDAILIYQPQSWRFNESPITFNTVIGQAVYTAADNPNIATMFAFEYMNYVQGNATFEVLQRDPQYIHLANQNGQITGPPDEFCYEANHIELYPMPMDVYPITVGGQFLVAAPATDDEANNPWMNKAERLIRSRAKFEIATHITRNPTMAAAMSPTANGNNGQPGASYDAWKVLKSDSNRITATNRVKAMKF